MKNKHTKNEESIFNLAVQYLKKYSSTVQQRHIVAGCNEQARRVTDWRRERRGEMVELQDHQQRRQRASCNFTHAWHWWHRFCFLAAFNSISSCSWSGTSVMSNSATLWTVACQSPLFVGFSHQESWSGCHALLQGIFLTQGLNSAYVTCIAGRFFTLEPWKKPPILSTLLKKQSSDVW